MSLVMTAKPKYVDVDAPFQPLPKHGHLSEKHPDFVAAEAAIDAGYAKIRDQPTMAAMRKLAGDADATMPPGAPDRYSEVVTELLQFPTRDGTLRELKVYKSPKVNPKATLMYRMHGGGWCVGRHEVDGVENVFAAINPNIVVASVDYRLAPEYPFPTPLHDSYDGLLWCKANADSLGVNPERIILSGGSAGGTLAAVLALEARENGITGIIAQVLHFPPICHPKLFPRDKYEYGSMIQNSENVVLSTVAMESAWEAYIPDATPDYRHSPLLAKSFKGLPPALIQCGGVDILRDEDIAYAEALQADGVEVEMYSYKGVPHWFAVVLPHISETVLYYERYNRFLEKHAKSGDRE